MNFNLETGSNLVLTTKLETMKKTKHIIIGIVLNEPKNMKAYKVELLVIDVDNIGEREITQLTDFISWLGENRPYHEGVLYGDMKDYIARIKSVNDKGDKIKK